MNNETEHETMSLWNDFKKGDDNAFVIIYERYVNILYNQGFRYTKSKEIIKDCIQEVFTKIYQYRSKLSATDNVRNYLMASMRNQLLTALSKEKMYSDSPPDTHSPPPPQETVERSAAEIMEAREDSIALEGTVEYVLSLLTVRQREAIYYRYIECLDMDEICALMKLNYQSLQNILSRSLKKIRQHLQITQKAK
jgi:RNA polymerase sigma factor (sigma-70 family)